MSNIKIYGKPNCAYCDAAKMLLDSKKIKYEYFELDKDFTREELMKLAPTARSYPQIFAGPTNIGGYKELLSAITIGDYQ